MPNIIILKYVGKRAKSAAASHSTSGHSNLNDPHSISDQILKNTEKWLPSWRYYIINDLSIGFNWNVKYGVKRFHAVGV